MTKSDRTDGRPEAANGSTAVARLLRRMTLKEKVSLLAGKDSWQTVDIPRLGVPSLVLTDGPHAVCAWALYASGQRPKTTCFPTGSAMGASWNPDLLEKVGRALGEETRGMGFDILLGPCINIMRTPLNGRNFETYSEDPFLTGRLAVAYVDGVQSAGVGASVKHFACNNQEFERFRGDSVVDERSMREIYLPAFEAVVKEARPWTVMCAYNRINGLYASRHEWLLRKVLKEEWGFDGIVVSDWGAVHQVEDSVRGGLDLEMPGPAKYLGPLLVDAVRNWQIEESDIDDAAGRILGIVERSGKLRGRGRRKGAVSTPAHQRLARQLAEESIVLFKNDDDLLPMAAGKLKSLAVIGPNATAFQYGGGGSSAAFPPYTIQPLDALKKVLGKRVKIEHAAGCSNVAQLLPMSVDGGFAAEFFNGERCEGAPVASREDGQILYQLGDRAPMDGVNATSFSARWTAEFSVDEDGEFWFMTQTIGASALYLDDRLILKSRTARKAVQGSGRAVEGEAREKRTDVTLERGRTYRIRLEYHKHALQDRGIIKLRFGRPPGWRVRDGIAGAAALAARCDAAVVFVGMPNRFEQEGGDRPHMHLPGPQDELVRAVARANPRTAAVLNVGAPVTMPWAGEVPAILLGWYSGQEGGNAIARVLIGKAEPGGRLPVTFPARYEDNPTIDTYPGGRRVHYREGVFVGYRHYDKQKVAPLFPFGHGLSYTTFEYGRLRVSRPAKNGKPARVSIEVRNAGSRAGSEVVQVYVGPVRSRVKRPVRELKAFAKVPLAPGERRTVTFELNARAFAYYDVKKASWVVAPGDFEIAVGRSSRDIRRTAIVTAGVKQ